LKSASKFNIGHFNISKCLVEPHASFFQSHSPTTQIRNVIVYEANSDSGEAKRVYFTIPYCLVDLEDEADILTSQNMPNKLRPLLRLFREAINSTSPHYRLLCLYRIKEGLDGKIKGDNTRIVKSRGITPRRKPVLVPDNRTTRHYFPHLLGKPVSDFLEYVNTNYRISIAHLNLDEYEKMLLDPAFSKTNHEIEVVNSTLVTIVTEMIKNEWEFMKEHNMT